MTEDTSFMAWLEAELEKAKQLSHSSDTWTRKNADNRFDQLSAAAKVWAEYKSTHSKYFD